jgi:hypothetical protein
VTRSVRAWIGAMIAIGFVMTAMSVVFWQKNAVEVQTQQWNQITQAFSELDLPPGAVETDTVKDDTHEPSEWCLTELRETRGCPRRSETYRISDTQATRFTITNIVEPLRVDGVAKSCSIVFGEPCYILDGESEAFPGIRVVSEVREDADNALVSVRMYALKT